MRIIEGRGEETRIIKYKRNLWIDGWAGWKSCIKMAKTVHGYTKKLEGKIKKKSKQKIYERGLA